MDFFLYNVLANVLLNGFEWAFKERPFVTLVVTLGLLGMAAFLMKLYVSPAA
jgi:hypothetical protein